VHSITIHLPYSGVYDWAAALRFFAARAVDGVEQVDGDLYRRTVRIDDSCGVLEVNPARSGAELQARLHLSNAADKAEVIARLRRMFDLDADLSLINAHLALDPFMARLVRARPALRVFGGWDPFEVAMRTINGQQVSVERARHLNGVLVTRCRAGLRSAHRDALRSLFPTAREVIAADLAGMGMPGARVATLKTMAEAAIADDQLFDTARSLDDTIARLRAIKGIGEWTAQYIAMRAGRQPDAFPASDVGLLRGAAGRDGLRPTPAALLRRAEAWRPWRAYAAHHLWNVDSSASSGVRTILDAATVGA
jgi:AraC family transcriptional regulator of adaptative response / DNA-3-methyladenine glycosylase II